jgi:hypothetical protein
MSRFAEIGRVKDLLIDNQVQESDLDLFVQEWEAGLFCVTDICPEWIAKQKAANPHRFKGHTTTEESLLRSAFIDGNLTAQGKVLEQCNGDIDRANAIAARFGGKMLQTKRGIDPADKATKGERNPWSPNYQGKDAELERVRIIKTLGTKMAASMAASCEVDLAGRPLRRRSA